VSRRDRLVKELIVKDNKRYEWIKEKLDIDDFIIPEERDFVRRGKFDLDCAKIKNENKIIRQQILDKVRQDFDVKKVEFFIQRNKTLRNIERELKELGYDNLGLPDPASFETEKDLLLSIKELKVTN
jgi:hypothetical protein